MAPVRRGYADAPHGQLHYYAAPGPAHASQPSPPLYCLHATAYSGQTFLPLMQLLSEQRRVFALDTPGYGGSDAPAAPLDVGGYAGAIAAGILATRPRAEPVDLLGYHFGAILAIELAATMPQLVRRLVLVGVPFFEGQDKPIWRNKLLFESSLGESFDQFRHRWEYFVTHRPPGMPLVRAYANFVDELRAYPREWWAYRALFEHDTRARLLQVRAPVRVISFDSPLAVHSRAAAALMAQASLHELPQLSGAPLDLGAGLIAPLVGEFLGGDTAEAPGMA